MPQADVMSAFLHGQGGTQHYVISEEFCPECSSPVSADGIGRSCTVCEWCVVDEMEAYDEELDD